VRAFVALGANLQDPVAQVRSGARALAALDRTRRCSCSSLYRTAPIGDTNQPAFINAVCELETDLPPRDLMQALLDIELAHGRVRDRPGGPRTLDLDLLWYDGQVLQEPALTLPHPRLHERAFVLYPLYELAPGLEIPGQGRVEDLLPACQGQVVERLAEQAG
jgi:2-amino-4-hydroxy-6-hydroxymethyldihydropteridine diphosphokinase